MFMKRKIAVVVLMMGIQPVFAMDSEASGLGPVFFNVGAAVLSSLLSRYQVVREPRQADQNLEVAEASQQLPALDPVVLEAIKHQEQEQQALDELLDIQDKSPRADGVGRLPSFSEGDVAESSSDSELLMDGSEESNDEITIADYERLCAHKRLENDQSHNEIRHLAASLENANGADHMSRSSAELYSAAVAGIPVGQEAPLLSSASQNGLAASVADQPSYDASVEKLQNIVNAMRVAQALGIPLLSRQNAVDDSLANDASSMPSSAVDAESYV